MKGQTRASLNRIEQWPNDDLLIEDHAREFIQKEFPRASHVFDWSSLRQEFTKIDDRAVIARKRRQWTGFVIIGGTGIASLLTAVLPLIELAGGSVARSAFGAAAAISALGLLFSLIFIAVGRSKSAWLEHRLQTERLRQFYFQFLISNSALAVKSMSDPIARLEWEREQRDAAELFKAWKKRPMSAELTSVIEDVNDKKVWLRSCWRQLPKLPSVGSDLDVFLEIFRQQRMGIQLHYVREKLQPGFGSPESRLKFSQLVGYTCAAFAFVATTTAAALLLKGLGTTSIEFRILTSAAAVCGAVGVICKVLAEGLQLKTDVERYRWYQAAVSDIDAEFNNPDIAVRFDLLRKMEHVAYREMREFLKIHDQSKFQLG